MGIGEGGRLGAMAGGRMAIPDYREMIVVCTHFSSVEKGLPARGSAPSWTRSPGFQEISYRHVRQDNINESLLQRGLGFWVQLFFGEFRPDGILINFRPNNRPSIEYAPGPSPMVAAAVNADSPS